jgi:hypothetical protein
LIAPLVFDQLFFPKFDQLAATIAVFATFAAIALWSAQETSSCSADLRGYARGVSSRQGRDQPRGNI